jgi:predicted ABC-type ATPase
MKPRLLVVAGPNGSGKTSITEQLHDLKHKWMAGCEYINPDKIAQEKYGDWNNQTYILKAAQEAERLRWKYLDEKCDFAFETVLSTPDKVNFIREAVNRGFFVRIFFVGTESPQININRVGIRYLEGGHSVPIEKIVSRYHKSMSNILELATFVDRVYFYDNSVDLPKGEVPNWQPVFRTISGACCEKYARPQQVWASDIYDALQSYQTFA